MREHSQGKPFNVIKWSPTMIAFRPSCLQNYHTLILKIWYPYRGRVELTPCGLVRIIRHLPKSVSVVRTSEDRRKPAEQTRGRERGGERASRYLSVGQSQEGERKGKRKKEVSRGGRGAMLDSQCNAVALPTTNQHAHTHAFLCRTIRYPSRTTLTHLVRDSATDS